MFKINIVVYWILLYITLAEAFPTSKLKPIILIPGNGGSQIEAKVDREANATVQQECNVKRDWFRLWMNVWELFPENVLCWVSYAKLEYDPETRASRNAPGVTTRIPGFGDTETIEYIDPSWTAFSLGNIGSYFKPLVELLVKWGYVRGETVRGAPYDFRFALHSMSDYFAQLKDLIEDSYTNGGEERVMLVAHSQGGLVGMYFLRQQEQSWKDKYIHSFMALNTPWGGSHVILTLLTSGYSQGIKSLDPLLLRDQQRSSESSVMLLPKYPAVEHNETLISTPRKNYTVLDYADWFEDIGFPTGNDLMEIMQQPDYSLGSPGVDFYCWHGSGFETSGPLVYNERFPNSRPVTIEKVEGDGVVSRASLRACGHFMTDGSHTLSLREFKGAEHIHIFSHKVFHNQLKRVILDKHGNGENSEKSRHKFRLFSFLYSYLFGN